MKKIKSLIIFILIGNAVYAQYAYKLNGTAPNTLDGTKVIFNLYDNAQLRILKKDSAIVENGRFSFSGSMPELVHNAFVALKNKHPQSSSFVIDTGTNELHIENGGLNSYMRITTDSYASKKHTVFLGIWSKYMAAYRQSVAPKKVFGMSGTKFEKAMYEESLELIKKYPNDYISLLELSNLSKLAGYERKPVYARKILEVFGHLSPHIQSFPLGQTLYERKQDLIKYDAAAMVGNKAREFTMKTVDGKDFSNKSLIGYNYILAFSATWCAPCQEELPKLKSIYEQYKHRGLKVIYFNDDDDVEKWKEHVIKNKLTWINVSESVKPSERIVSKSFNVNSYPNYILVNKEGIIVYNSSQSDLSRNQLSTEVGKLFAAK